VCVGGGAFTFWCKRLQSGEKSSGAFEDIHPYADGNSTLICQEIQVPSCIDATFTVDWSLRDESRMSL